MAKANDGNAFGTPGIRRSLADVNPPGAGGDRAIAACDAESHVPSRVQPSSRRQRIVGGRLGRAVAATVACLLQLAGCSATLRQRHTFIAEDPDTGERALYRVEIFGAGIGAVKYDVSGAYLPQTAIDLYDGKIPQTLADIDSVSPTGDSTTGKILAEYHQLLEAQAVLERAANEDSPLSLADRRTVRRFFADAVSDSMLSVSDLRSISESGSDDPYRFRKLVYFVSTEPLRVQDFQGEIDEIESTMNTIAQMLSDARRQRKQAAEAKRAQQKQRLQAMASFLEGTPNLNDPQKAWELFGLITGDGQ